MLEDRGQPHSYTMRGNGNVAESHGRNMSIGQAGRIKAQEMLSFTSLVTDDRTQSALIASNPDTLRSTQGQLGARMTESKRCRICLADTYEVGSRVSYLNELHRVSARIRAG